MDNREKFNSEETTGNFNFMEQITPYVSRWKWFLAGGFLALLVAFLYLRYATPLYKASTTIMLKDENKGGTVNEFSILSDLNIGVKDNVENEVEVLRSRTLSEKVVKKLNLNVSYFPLGKKKPDLYKESPVNITLEKIAGRFDKEMPLNLEVKGLSDIAYNFYNDGKLLGKYNYGETVKNEIGQFVVNKSELYFSKPDFGLSIELNGVENTAQIYRRVLNVNLLGKNTSVLELSSTNSNKEKAIDYLNTLVEIYNSDAIADRRFISENTSDFLTQRLDILTKEIDAVEKTTEKFKKDNQVTDIVSEANLYTQNTSEFEKRYLDVNTRVELIDNVIKGFIDTETTGKTFPMLDALTADPALSAAINEHNKLVLSRNESAVNAGPENFRIKQMDEQIKSLKKAIKENLILLKSNLNIQKSDISRQQRVLSGRVSSVPTLEREFREITRQQGVKDALYLYLLEKREEAEISTVALAPNAKVIDRAFSSNIPVSPKKMIIYLAALILGLVIPFTIIYLSTLLDNKIKNKSDVEKYLSAPYLGDVPHTKSDDKIIKANSNSEFAEALRIIRTNMDFILGNIAENRSKSIFVTSSLPKEGKTFMAMNLAGTFALSGKKTLLIEMDIRNPKIGQYLKLPSQGLTNYLASSDIDINSVIVKVPDFKELYVIPAKVVPPNPAELLMNPKLAEMFEYLKTKFDYIIVDTAPVNLVADTLLTAKNADAFVYVVRENQTTKEMLQKAQKLHKENKLPNMCVLLNDTTVKANDSYGYGYFQDKHQKKPWWKKILG
ncbi:GumC family protein [Capnocytophaga cynodegmi]|uniref:non-specific protein-tyrosine kinase n=1 Tax=Capnocytophaga cynodegmi TaxID=28189 RepID=A0A0B7HTW5_9FLAO|nr:polysaccharide biosynthesis tyrosine autokinase [Capnocytophaga cynodegmi]CEN40958.1 Tyrosine-protein kinase involved in exopolysaccharide biosynthesis [Capnocytophaga cynodegmi]CEN42257.1 Tyrosine-protein kinase involved in exopolysaccharide biosynthesis [Capnocytophaga cynodegmi]